MTARCALVLAVALGAATSGVALAQGAAADPTDAPFRAAATRAASGDPGVLDAFEQIGATTPPGAFSDDAWIEAARLAERSGDLARARRDLERAIALGLDPQLVRRARGELARLARIGGEHGEWQQVAATHDRLEARAFGGGDPTPALRELEQLVRDNPQYPRVTAARIALARGWEGEGEVARAIGVLREAVAHAPDGDRETARIALVRTLAHAGDVDEADHELAEIHDARIAEQLRGDVATARHRHLLRMLLLALLAIALVALVVLVRRDAGSWRTALRRIARPPIEIAYFAPIGLVLVLIAWSGNPLVASAVRTIAIAGGAIAWLSGAALESARVRTGRLAARRAIAQAVLAMAAVGAATYLVISSNQLIDLVAETVRTGPVPR